MAKPPAGRSAQGHILPDVLKKGLKVVFCGMAAGEESAQAGVYYVKSGNKFWLTLYEAGLTCRQLSPYEFKKALKCHLGLTDLCKFHAGTDRSLPPDAADPLGLADKIEKYAPQVLAFNGKELSQKVLKDLHGTPKSRVDYGLQEKTIGTSKVWVLPSTSGLNGHWKKYKHHWWDLADYIGQKSA